MSLIIKRTFARPRRNLVILRAGEKTIHPYWLRDISDEARSWDLMISYYGENPSWIPEPYEYLTLQKGQKWPPILDLVRSGQLPMFDYVWIPDDDLLTTWGNINKLFEVMARYSLELAQPALTENSFFSWQATRVDRRWLLRYSAFVEIMAPAFSRRAFEICAPAINGVVTGWGLDFVWPHLLGDPTDKIAMIDGAPIFHTRPVAASYDTSAAEAEMRATLERYGTRVNAQIHSAIPLSAW